MCELPKITPPRILTVCVCVCRYPLKSKTALLRAAPRLSFTQSKSEKLDNGVVSIKVHPRCSKDLFTIVLSSKHHFLDLSRARPKYKMLRDIHAQSKKLPDLYLALDTCRSVSRDSGRCRTLHRIPRSCIGKPRRRFLHTNASQRNMNECQSTCQTRQRPSEL